MNSRWKYYHDDSADNADDDGDDGSDDDFDVFDDDSDDDGDDDVAVFDDYKDAPGWCPTCSEPRSQSHRRRARASRQRLGIQPAQTIRIQPMEI